MIREELLAALRAKEGAFGAAVRRTVEEIAASGGDRLARIWREFGAHILRHLDREDRLRSAASDVRAALRIAVPLGNSGHRKTLQSLSRTDVLRIAALRGNAGRTQLEHEKVLQSLAGRVGDGRVGDVWGEITTQQRKQILEALGIRVAGADAVVRAA